jgi:hypothetical protein
MSSVANTSQVLYEVNLSETATKSKTEPMICRFTENSRRITIVYTCNDDGIVRYGASIFKKEKPSDSYSKKGHRHTAMARFLKKPVEVELKNTSDQDYVENKLRSCLFKYGVKAHAIEA